MKIAPTASNAMRKYLVLSVSAMFSSLRLRNETAGLGFSVKGFRGTRQRISEPVLGFRLADSIPPTDAKCSTKHASVQGWRHRARIVAYSSPTVSQITEVGEDSSKVRVGGRSSTIAIS